MYFYQLLIITLSFGLALAKPLYNNGKTLVIVDNPNQYSSYIQSLTDRDHQIFVKNVNNQEEDSSLELIRYGQLAYNNVVIFPTNARSLGPQLSSKALLEYFNLGGNILAVTNSKSSPESVREFAAELDIHISPRGYQIVDHFNVQEGDDDSHTSLHLTSANIDAPESVISKLTSDNEFVYSGNGAYLGNNELIIPLIFAPSTSYVYDAREQEDPENAVATKLWVSGTQAYLAASLQSRGNSRFTWIGSSELFNNNASLSASIIDNITKWTFNEKSIVRIDSVSHYDLSYPEVENPHIYKVSTDILYEIAISEYNGVDWVAFDAKDIQLEFVMLDPYYRLTLQRNKTAEASHSSSPSAIYSVQFQCPDQYGMFTFKTDYRRPGYSFIEDSRVVTVRHTANDEWPRSWEITNSWVYLTSASSVVIAWLVFVIIYLYTGYSTKPSEKKTQ